MRFPKELAARVADEKFFMAPRLDQVVDAGSTEQIFEQHSNVRIADHVPGGSADGLLNSIRTLDDSQRTSAHAFEPNTSVAPAVDTINVPVPGPLTLLRTGSP